MDLKLKIFQTSSSFIVLSRLAQEGPRYSWDIVVSIEFSPLSSVELTNSWYQLHNGDCTGILFTKLLDYTSNRYCTVETT